MSDGVELLDFDVVANDVDEDVCGLILKVNLFCFF